MTRITIMVFPALKIRLRRAVKTLLDQYKLVSIWLCFHAGQLLLLPKQICLVLVSGSLGQGVAPR